MFTRRDISWGYTAQLLNIGAGIIMLPVVVGFMSVDQVGLWFVFISIASLIQLLELGFQPILIRNFSYVYAGAKELKAHSLPECQVGYFDQDLFSSLVVAAKLIYSTVSFLSAFLLLGLGSFYIYTLLPEHIDEFEVFAGWSLYAVGLVFSFYYGYLNAILQGRGQVSEANKVVVFSRLFFVVVGAGMVVAGYGLIGMGLASVLSSIFSRLLALKFVYSKSHPEMKINSEVAVGNAKKIVFILWYNASRFGVVLVGVFLIWRANVLIAASLLGLSEAASYGLAIQLFFMLNTVASVPLSISLPKINTWRAQSKHQEVYSGFSMLLALSLCMYLAGAVLVFSFGDYLLAFINSPTRLPDNLVLGSMVLVFLLEINHGSCANFIATGNKTPFAAASILTGITIVVASVSLTPALGVWGLVLAQGVTQLLYNNWKWPLEVSKMLKVSYFRMLKDGFWFVYKYKF